MAKKYNIGLALGGGGARGFAHLGVYKALIEKGINIDVISGVSAGAIAGAFLAAGVRPEDALEAMDSKGITDFSGLSFSGDGLLDLDEFEKYLAKKIPIEKIEDLKIPLFIGVTNLLKGKSEYLEKGNLARAVKASSSIPVLFKPVRIGTKFLSDGGVLNNLPIDVLQNKCEKVIAVSISPLSEVDNLHGMLEIAARVFQLSVNSQLQKLNSSCHLFIQPEGIENFEILSATKAKAIFELGYNYALNMDLSSLK